MPKPKKIVACEDDLIALEEKLLKIINDNRDQADSDVKATESKWRGEVAKVQQTVVSNAATAEKAVEDARAEARTFTEECVQALNESIVAIAPPLDEKIETVHKDALTKLDELDTKLQQFVVDELTELAKSFDDEIKALKAELKDDVKTMGQEAANELVAQRKQIDASIEELRIACEEDRNRIRAETKEKLDDIVAKQCIRDEKQDDAKEALKRDLYFEVGKLEDSIREKEAKASSHTNSVAETAAKQLSDIDEKQTLHLRALDVVADHLKGRVQAVEHMQTRRVEWVIKDASKTITPGPGGWSGEKVFTSWFSPAFDASGVSGMRLELQMYRPPGPKSTEEERKAGNLGVFLWACKGMKLAFKLYIGDRCTQFDKKFNGRAPCGTHRFCFLKDQIDTENDTLRVGIEFMEVLRELEEPINPSSTSTAKKDGALDGTADGSITSMIVPAGSMCVMRHSSNRVIEQVRKEVQVMESKMVRKIDWLVQKGSKLRQYFLKDEALCSPVFKAAGLDNLQLILYPSGYGPATPGFCSVFLYGPAGANVHCFLTLGNQSREIFHTFEVSGAYGRTNFCMFDPVIDVVDDTVLLTLEIEEAQQDQSAIWLHEEVKPREPDSHRTLESEKELQSIIKLTKNPGKSPLGKPNGRGGKMDTHMSLPSYWSAKPLGDNHSPPDGFHPFEEVTQRKPLAFGIDTSQLKTSRPQSEQRGLRRNTSQSTPSLQTLGRTAMSEDLSPPLPNVSAGPPKAVPDWEQDVLGGASSMGQSRKFAARRSRPLTGSSERLEEQ